MTGSVNSVLFTLITNWYGTRRWCCPGKYYIRFIVFSTSAGLGEIRARRRCAEWIKYSTVTRKPYARRVSVFLNFELNPDDKTPIYRGRFNNRKMKLFSIYIKQTRNIIKAIRGTNCPEQNGKEWFYTCMILNIYFW